MALEAPLSINFIQDYFTATYSASTPISFRSINSALGRTTPDAFSDFLNNQVNRFTFISSGGSVSGINSATGDLDSSFNNYKTFQQFTSGSSTTSSVWKLENTYHYGFLSGYTIRFYLLYDYIVSGAPFTGTIFVEQGSSSSGPFSIKSVLTSQPTQTNSFAFTPSTSDNDYFRLRVQNDSTNSINIAFGIGIEVT